MNSAIEIIDQETVPMNACQEEETKIERIENTD